VGGTRGLVKFDFLGLKTLTVLDQAVKLLRKRDVHLDLLAIPLDDPATFAMLSRADSSGVFQFESTGSATCCASSSPTSSRISSPSWRSIVRPDGQTSTAS